MGAATYFERFRGVLPPLVTPLDAEGGVQEEAFRTLIRRTLPAGVNGLVVLGTTGEGAVIERDQRYRAIEIAVDEVGGKVPILVGTGDVNTHAIKANNRQAARLGAAAALVVPPFYFPQRQSTVVDFYREIAAEGSLPIVIYNFPQMTKICVEPEAVEALCREDGIIGIKDSSANFLHFQAFLGCQSDSFVVYQGVGAMTCASLLMGAGGFISPVANIDPFIEMELYAAVRDGEVARAKELQNRIKRLISLWRGYNGPAPSVIKALLGIMGVFDTYPSKPNPVIEGAELEALRLRFNQVLER